MIGSPEESAQLDRLLGYLKLDDSNQNLMLDALELAIELGQIEKALELTHNYQEQAGQNSVFCAHAGFVLMATGDLDSALELLTRAESLGNSDANVLFNLATCLSFQAKYETSLEYLNQHPSITEYLPVQSRILRARLLHHLDDFVQAIAVLEWIHNNVEMLAESAGLLALIEFENGASAQKVLELANFSLYKQPHNIEALIARISIDVQENNLSRATADAETLTKQYPELGRGWSSCAQVAFAKLDFEFCAQAATTANKYMPDHIGTWHLLGWSYIMLNKAQEALEAFNKASDIDARFADTHGGLAAAYAHLGYVDKARRHINIAKKLNPNGNSAAYAEIVLLQQNSSNDLAIKLLDDTVSKFDEATQLTINQRIQQLVVDSQKNPTSNKSIH